MFVMFFLFISRDVNSRVESRYSRVSIQTVECVPFTNVIGVRSPAWARRGGEGQSPNSDLFLFSIEADWYASGILAYTNTVKSRPSC